MENMSEIVALLWVNNRMKMFSIKIRLFWLVFNVFRRFCRVYNSKWIAKRWSMFSRLVFLSFSFFILLFLLVRPISLSFSHCLVLSLFLPPSFSLSLSIPYLFRLEHSTMKSVNWCLWNMSTWFKEYPAIKCRRGKNSNAWMVCKANNTISNRKFIAIIRGLITGKTFRSFWSAEITKKKIVLTFVDNVHNIGVWASIYTTLC